MRRTLGVVLVVLVCFAVHARAAVADGFVLIRNARNPTTQVSRADVRLLYTGRTRMLGGSPAMVVVRGEDDVVFARFADRVFSITPKLLLTKIKQEVFKGEMARPVKAVTDDEVIEAVSAAAGNIGVVSASTAAKLPASVATLALSD
jgi:ABC-type phosphate transport system substrate-binding protein|nr:hypothetical protein [Kofleriaceae bacterium]